MCMTYFHTDLPAATSTRTLSLLSFTDAQVKTVLHDYTASECWTVLLLLQIKKKHKIKNHDHHLQKKKIKWECTFSKIHYAYSDPTQPVPDNNHLHQCLAIKNKLISPNVSKAENLTTASF